MVKINFGDVIFVKRSLGYRHFGIYSGNRKVIHYVKNNGNELDGTINETSLEKFLGDDKDCYVCNFDERGRRTSESLAVPASAGANPALGMFDLLKIVYDIYTFLNSENGKLYSPEETVARARSKIGESNYNLILDNCEHFAIWCKTGLYKSEQVEEFLNIFTSTSRI